MDIYVNVNVSKMKIEHEHFVKTVLVYMYFVDVKFFTFNGGRLCKLYQSIIHWTL